MQNTFMEDLKFKLNNFKEDFGWWLRSKFKLSSRRVVFTFNNKEMIAFIDKYTSYIRLGKNNNNFIMVDVDNNGMHGITKLLKFDCQGLSDKQIVEKIKTMIVFS